MEDSSRIMVPVPPSHRPRKLYRRKKIALQQRPKSAKERSPIKRDPCRITLYYHGKGVKLPFDKKVFDTKDQITVFQQHCGGENLIVYKGNLDENSKLIK